MNEAKRREVVLQLTGALKFAAQRRALVTYKELAKIAGLPLSGSYMGREIGRLLGEISHETYRRWSVMLSSIVIHTADGRVGDGFYSLARDIGAIRGRMNRDAKARFLTEQRERAFRRWSLR